jgi:hypothetical protein
VTLCDRIRLHEASKIELINILFAVWLVILTKFMTLVISRQNSADGAGLSVLSCGRVRALLLCCSNVSNHICYFGL